MTRIGLIFRVGGFAGHPRYAVDAKIDGVFWDRTTAGVSDAVGMFGDDDGITALETGEFSDDSRFDWDFDDVWTIGEAPDGEGRPVLQWQ